MIDINLVPAHLRKKKKGRSVAVKESTVPKETVIGLAIGLIFLLAVVHILLQSYITVRLVQHKKNVSQLEQLAGSKGDVDKMLEDLRALRARVESVEAIAGGEPVLWSRKLNALSDSLPRGVWLNRLTLESGILLIQGSAVSKVGTEMMEPHTLRTSLEKNTAFTNGVKDVKIGFVKSRNIEQTQVADFTINVDLQPEGAEQE